MFVKPQWPASAKIKAVSTTRIGGVSTGIYGALNLGAHVGDDDAAVEHNRSLLTQALSLPAAPNWLNQVHGAEIVDAAIIDASTAPGVVPDADGCYSHQENAVCVVMTADCLPLLLSNIDGSEIAAVHVGWRGMAAGIIERAVAKFNCAPSEILAWAGPSIGPRKFEIGLDVRHQLGGSDDAFQTAANGKVFANLYQLAGERLSALKVTEYSYADTCTYSDSERFFSYRRDGQCGRMASLIWLEPGR